MTECFHQTCLKMIRRQPGSYNQRQPRIVWELTACTSVSPFVSWKILPKRGDHLRQTQFVHPSVMIGFRSVKTRLSAPPPSVCGCYWSYFRPCSVLSVHSTNHQGHTVGIGILSGLFSLKYSAFSPKVFEWNQTTADFLWRPDDVRRNLTSSWLSPSPSPNKKNGNLMTFSNLSNAFGPASLKKCLTGGSSSSSSSFSPSEK